MKLIRTMAAVIGVASVLTACGGSGSDAAKTLGITDPEIHFENAVPGSSPYDFLVNGSAPGGQTNVAYLGVTNFTNIGTGATTVAYAATGTKTALASGSFPDVANGHEYTVIALPGLTSPGIGMIDDPFDKGLLSNDARVRAFNASANATNLDIYIVPAGTNGGVNVFVSDPSQVVLDISGYFAPVGTSSVLAFYPLTPCRLVDTRNANGPLGGPTLVAGTTRDFPLRSGSCNLPSDAAAYSLNVTAVPQGSLPYLTIWPSGQSQPTASTLNAPTGTVVANGAIVPAGSNGDVNVYVGGTSDVVIDVNGYFATPGAGGLSLYATTPCRVLDTRNGTGAFSGVMSVNVESSTCAPPSSAQAYVVNATVVPTGALNYLTLWPAGETQPQVSTLNAYDGVIASNMATVPTVNGSINAFAANPTQLILDLFGYYAP